MKRLLIAFIFIVSANIFAQESSSEVKTRDYTLEQFSGIDIGGAFEIVIEQGETQNVKITAKEQFLDKLTVEVNDGILMIKTNTGILKNNEKIQVHITFTHLSSINISGVTEVNSASLIEASKLFIKSAGASEIDIELEVDDLSLEVSGAGKVKLKGNAQTLQADISGAGYLKAKQLKVENADVSVSGAGNAYLNVTNSLECSVSGAANVNYSGNPETKNFTKSGSGNISAEDVVEKEITVISVNDDDEYVNVRVGGLGIEVIEDGDTTKIALGRHNLIIDDKGNVKYRRCKNTKFNGHWGGVDLGVNGYLTKDRDLAIPPEYNFLDLKQEKSWTLSVNPFEQNFNLARNHLGLITGIGLQWINYRFDNNIVLSGDSSTIYGFKDYSRNYTKSKLTVCFVNIPLLMEYQTNRHMKSNSFHIAAGMVFGLRIGSHSKMAYEDGSKQKFKDRDDFHLNPFKMDASVRIGWGWINLFGTYSINTLFKKNNGPELYPFTAGITLAGW